MGGAIPAQALAYCVPIAWLMRTRVRPPRVRFAAPIVVRSRPLPVLVCVSRSIAGTTSQALIKEQPWIQKHLSTIASGIAIAVGALMLAAAFGFDVPFFG